MSGRKRTIANNYTVLAAIEIGGAEIVVAENQTAKKGEYYICCFVDKHQIFENYTQIVASDNYAEIIKEYGERISRTADEVLNLTKNIEKYVPNAVIGRNECHQIDCEESIEGKVVVVDSEKLCPEYRYVQFQIMLCTGGFGSHANPRGRTCFCESLFTGERLTFYRSDIIGTLSPEELPDWAKRGLQKAQGKHNLK